MPDGSNDSFRSLKVWRESMDLTEDVYRLSTQLPQNERYGLGSQIKRAAVSIPSNLAEGKASRSDAVFLRHVRIARGSTAELETQIRLIRRLSLGSSEVSEGLWRRLQLVGRLVTGLEQRLERDVGS